MCYASKSLVRYATFCRDKYNVKISQRADNVNITTSTLKVKSTVSGGTGMQNARLFSDLNPEKRQLTLFALLCKSPEI